jgi:hypothetical protein
VDISKLPKLSQTPADPPPVEETPAPETTPAVAEPVQPHRDERREPELEVSPGEIWFNLIVGIIFLFLGQRFGGFAMATLMHQPYHTGFNWSAGPKAGQEVAYLELDGKPYLSESAMFLFGLAVLADTALLFAIAKRSKARRVLVSIALFITAAATVYNLYIIAALMKMNVMPLVSLLAVAFGGYMAFQQWALFKIIRGRTA